VAKRISAAGSRIEIKVEAKASPERGHRCPHFAARSANEMYKLIKRGIFLWAIVLVFAGGMTSFAKDAQPNEDPQIEQRMRTLTEQLRCLVCQNETLADSRADLAEDLRRQIREQIKAGKSDREIIAYLTDRYGDFVLYNPQVKPKTFLLWFPPFILLPVGIAVLYLYLKKRRELISDKPLTADEHKRAEALLRNEIG
jgi:cytochrome c-type biogenesis protein CcmH